MTRKGATRSDGCFIKIIPADTLRGSQGEGLKVPPGVGGLGRLCSSPGGETKDQGLDQGEGREDGEKQVGLKSVHAEVGLSALASCMEMRDNGWGQFGRVACDSVSLSSGQHQGLCGTPGSRWDPLLFSCSSGSLPPLAAALSTTTDWRKLSLALNPG